jgi:hypothetical protein
MYKEIELGMHFELFSDETIDSMFLKIQNDVIDLIKKSQDNKQELEPMIFGAFGIGDVPLKKGGKTGVWMEYNCQILPFGVIDAKIGRIIIYDKIPDEVLDRYNDIKKMIFN